MPTLTEALRSAVRDLIGAGVPSPAVDARLLLCAATGLDRLALIRDPGLWLSAEAVARFDDFVARRVAREPVSRILGTRAFWSLDLRITPDVLDPRADTEILIEALLDALGDRRVESLRVLDLGTGSGAILCALLSELPHATGWAVDRSAGACAVARSNLDACGLTARSLVVQGDWGAALAAGRFDVVASNPPYIETAVIPSLDVDVRHHDPVAALDGGADGFDAYRTLAADLPRLLAPGGVAGFEVGRGQDGEVGRLMAAAGLAGIGKRRDLGGIDRVVTGRWSGQAAAATRPSA